jgi:cleavage and polyadenylation specificity factor subunit 1
MPQGSTTWEPLGFFSKKLKPAQTRYSAFARELLTFVTSICYFHYVWEGRQFALLTDHNPLTFALGRISEPWTARQARHLSYIAEYTSDIRHISGVSNVVADMMSRPPPRPQGQPLQLPNLLGRPRRLLM